ncbi:MAG: hypothetical protein LBQ60_14955, partial [Bacteroidales bacterium]|nr:hypothetical protein [Bacteroidales bacterium]
MKKFKKILFLRILWLVLSVALFTFLVTRQLYGWSMIVLPLMIWCIVRLYAWITRSIKDMERLTDAIRYSDLNISFNPSVKKGLPEELAKKMEGSIE